MARVWVIARSLRGKIAGWTDAAFSSPSHLPWHLPPPANNCGNVPRVDPGKAPIIDIVRGAALLGILLMNILGFSMPFAAEATYEISRLAMTLGHLCWLVLLARTPSWTWMSRPLAAVGKMAFSNYIVTSLICTTIFYCYGFKLYGKLERHQLYYIVAGVWIVNLLWSTWWLKRYRFGSLEWCWRSLTYWQKQPMRLEAATSST